MPATSSACSSCSPCTRSSTRSSPPTTPTPSPRCSRSLPPGAAYEFQRLHGMGEALYAAARAELPAAAAGARVRASGHARGAAAVSRAPAARERRQHLVRPSVHEPADFRGGGGARSHHLARGASRRSPGACASRGALYGGERANSPGEDFGDPASLAELEAELRAHAAEHYRGGPILSGGEARDVNVPVTSPADTRVIVGLTRDATAQEIRQAMAAAQAAQPRLGCDARRWSAPRCLERAAELLIERRGEFLSLLVREAGKTLPDAVAELREAIDFCRYYAARGRELFGAPAVLAGPTGEHNTLSLNGRGVFVCISPWNFPLAIFTGQITAALMAGNAVVAKPAPATPLIAHAMTRLLHERRRAAGGAAAHPGGRPAVRRGGAHAPGARRRRLHRLHRYRCHHQPHARRARGPDRAVDRRDRRRECNGGGCDGIARAGGRRRHHLSVYQRRPALLGAAGAVRAGGDCRARDRHADRGDARSQDRRALASSRPTWVL